jgi:hypothetical protein
MVLEPEMGRLFGLGGKHGAVASMATGVKIIFLGEIVHLTKFKSQSHLLISYAAGLGGRAGDVGVVWGGGDGLDPSGGWRVLGTVKTTKIGNHEMWSM